MRPCHESDNLVHQLRQLIRSAGLPAIAERPVADLCSIERMGKERGRALRSPCRTFVLSSSRIDYVHYRRDLRPDRAYVAAARHLGNRVESWIWGYLTAPSPPAGATITQRG